MNNTAGTGLCERASANNSNRGGWRDYFSLFTTLVLSMFVAFAMSACGGGGGSSGTATVAAPAAPTNFAIATTTSGVMSETLTWSPPNSGGTPTSYEVYRSTTAGTAFQPANKITSIPAVAGQTKYTFVDSSGLTHTATYWAVSAKNAGGETATAELSATPTGDTLGFGNNFSGALIFADDVGITGSAIPATSTWSTSVASAVAETTTGLRPLSTEPIPSTVTTLPYLDPTTVYPLDGVNYYPQKSASTWQGQWALGGGATQHVTAKWGDNLVSQKLTTTSVVRVEMTLSEALTTPMTSYTMKSLYGTNANEVQGTDGTTYANSTASVFAANAHLKIQQVGAATTLVDQTLWAGDGPGFMAGEINVSGGFTYGYVWNLKNMGLTPGTYRLTFSLDNTSPVGTSNHTSIDSATNGTYVNTNEVYIDVVIN